MLRRLVQIHTAILAVASAVLLVAPGPVLAALGVVSPEFPVLALSRIIAALLTITAAAVLPLPHVARDARRGALWTIAAAYGASTALMLVQETAIWTSGTGAVVVVVGALLTIGFASVAAGEKRSGLAIA